MVADLSFQEFLGRAQENQGEGGHSGEGDGCGQEGDLEDNESDKFG